MYSSIKASTSAKSVSTIHFSITFTAMKDSHSGCLEEDMQCGVLESSRYTLLVIDLSVQRFLRVVCPRRYVHSGFEATRQAAVQFHANAQANHSSLTRLLFECSECTCSSE